MVSHFQEVLTSSSLPSAEDREEAILQWQQPTLHMFIMSNDQIQSLIDR